jgi:hypothetical protein
MRTQRTGELPDDVTVYASPLLQGDQAVVAGTTVTVPSKPPSQRRRRAFEAWHLAQYALAKPRRVASNA